MEKKNILVVGASQGIGAKTVEYLSNNGNTVIMVARNDGKMKEIQKSLRYPSLTFQYDLHDLEHVEDIFQFCANNDIILHGMVYCVGINRDMPIRINDVDVMQEVMKVNYMAFVELAKYFFKKKYSLNESSIVVLSSNATKVVSQGMGTYTSSKAALEAAVQVMAKEMIKRKIRVNAILPACVDTDMVDNAPFINKAEIENVQPFGLIEPEYISYLIEFLLSDKAKYITGALLPVSAGVI